MTSNSLRGSKICRACDSANLFSALDLGLVPIANELLVSASSTDVFPLHMSVCRDCGLGQVQDVVSPERLFRDYRYLSSISQTFLDHASNYAKAVYDDLDWRKEDWILEIASNDGYLLRNFVDLGIKVIGVEPAANVAEIARSHGVQTISDFFGVALAKQILQEHGYPRLIIANNVFAHVPNIQNFTEGLSFLMNNRTLASIENPSIMNLLIGLQFDSIYHEHYSYLSATSVSNLVQRFGLNLVDVQSIPTHGGSNRYWLSKDSSLEKKSVEQVIDFEKQNGLFAEDQWKVFSDKVSKILVDFSQFVADKHSQGETVAGYGAAAKASTLINASKIGTGEIAFIVDESPEKCGRFMPQVGIPIVPRNHLNEHSIEHIVIFPWNLADEIAGKIKASLPDRVKIWRAIPELEVVK
jgi:2-polyprenyl-3-methyl-5-hydroxy-6-metoxy-1,4-benzoquinol methylase